MSTRNEHPNAESAKEGLWTPWAQVICRECHTKNTSAEQKGAVSQEEREKAARPIELKEGNAVTFCDDCGDPVQVDEEVAVEHNLVRTLRERGIEATMDQTGGMCSACGVALSEEAKNDPGIKDPRDRPDYMLITYDDGGDGLYWMGTYTQFTETAEIPWANRCFGSEEEVLQWMDENRDKVAKLESPEKTAEDRPSPLDSLKAEAKNRAAEKNADRSEQPPNDRRREPER